jgi:multidrug resistance efflux pump
MKNSEIAKIGRSVKKEEKRLGLEVKKEEKGLAWFIRSDSFKIILLVLAFIVMITGIVYLTVSQSKVNIDASEISAPIITLSPSNPGILEKIFVKEGDYIQEDMIVAQIGGNPIRSKIDGLVVGIQNTPGEIVSSQTPVVRMIDPNELRLIGHIEENKGLNDIRPGQKVIFSVDAFSGKEYSGIVDSISQTSRQSDIVFSISDKRQEQQFDINVKFDLSAYPELRNGMSAKMQVYK